MKILEVKFHNLNSLSKEPTHIDFTAEPLASSGLFAITGPTGSGKSTILDAITLALFGKAARYGKNPNPEDMMSRQCGECWAEVRFAVPSGIYRAEWRLRRARGKPGATVQPVKRQVCDDAGTVLTQQVRDTDDKIEELLGLDYTRFLRSALLAQGEFAQFLKADPKERAALLESLTGTTIYSDLSKRAFEECRKREEKLAEQKRFIEAMTVLEDETRKALEKQMEERSRERPEAEKEVKALADALTDARSLKEAVGKEHLHQESLKALARSREELKPEVERLERHHLTLPFQEAMGSLSQLEKSLKTEEAASREAAETHAIVTEQARLCLTAFKAQLVDGKETLLRQQKEAETQLAALQGDMESLKAWLDTHQGDAGLPPILPTLSSELVDLKHTRSSLIKEWSELRTKVRTLGDEDRAMLPESPVNLDLAGLKGIFTDVDATLATQLKQAEQAAEEADKESRLAALNLENARKVASMEDARAELKSGAPCPLCGSTHHPYNEGAPPAFPFQELKEKLETAQKSAKKASKAFESLESLKADLKKETASLSSLLEALQDKVASLRHTLKPFGVALPDPGDEDTLAIDLRARAEAYTNQQKKRETAAHQHTLLKERHEALMTNLHALSQKLAKTGSIELPGRAPDISEGLRAKASLILPQEVDKLESLWEDLNFKRSESEVTLRQVRLSLEARRREYSSTLEKLNCLLQASAFASVDELKAAQLDKETVDRIEKRKTDLAEKETAAQTRLEEVRKTMAALRERQAAEGEAAAALEQKHEACAAAYSALLTELGSLGAQLKQDDAHRCKRKAAEEKIQTDLEALRIWEQLKGLIGSKDGNLFRKFAQGLSLQLLIQYANRQMARLNDRYQLQRSQGDDLKIEILDLHQAGAVRPMQSLSGGESFLASLALALGLSEMAGRNVRIDSLFIDEGFGSLDSDALDLAISALEALRSEHKTIGVISHVDLLKERIATQIRVDKQPGGVSSVQVRG